MTPFATRLLAHAHGHLGWLAAAALAHPAWLLRRPARRAPWSVGLATALVTLAAAAGAWAYPAYRAAIRRPLFADAPAAAWWFERKEHLAVGALVFAWVGCLAHFAALGAPDAAARAPAARCAHRAFVAAAALALASAVIGVAVAAVKSL